MSRRRRQLIDLTADDPHLAAETETAENALNRMQLCVLCASAVVISLATGDAGQSIQELDKHLHQDCLRPV